MKPISGFVHMKYLHLGCQIIDRLSALSRTEPVDS